MLTQCTGVRVLPIGGLSLLKQGLIYLMQDNEPGRLFSISYLRVSFLLFKVNAETKNRRYVIVGQIWDMSIASLVKLAGLQ